MADGMEYFEGSGNVYRDLGFKDPEKWAAKADLAIRINRIIEQRDLTPREAAEILDISRPRVSNLKRGQLEKFSMEKLLFFLTALDRDVDIVIRPKEEKIAHINVAEATRPEYVS